ncbi:MAG: WbqC family protein [Candidatus Eisenbacteria bacterium]
MKTLAILQSNYIPWKGYFDLIRSADEVIVFDCVQYTKHDWRNRNRIKTHDEVKWLTIPVVTAGRWTRPIHEIEVVDGRWATKHWKTLQQSYAHAPFFPLYAPLIQESLERAAELRHLSDINLLFLELVNRLLGIDTPLSSWSGFHIIDGKTERLVDLCRQTGATRYLSGPAAKNYIDESLFTAAGIELEYVDYSGYRPYPQLHGEFVHEVSVLDLLFSVGPDAWQYMKSLGDVTAEETTTRRRSA